jgi:hypothetical protein
MSSNYLSFYPQYIASYPDPTSADVDTLYSVGVPAQLNVFPMCPTAVEETSWGSIKSLYR